MPARDSQPWIHRLHTLAAWMLRAMVSLLIWGSGLLYLFRNFWPQFGLDWLPLEWVAWAPTAHIKAMVTGWEALHGDEARREG